jgi:hypothetical protein
MNYPSDYPKIFRIIVGLVVRLWTLEWRDKRKQSEKEEKPSALALDKISVY